MIVQDRCSSQAQNIFISEYTAVGRNTAFFILILMLATEERTFQSLSATSFVLLGNAGAVSVFLMDVAVIRPRLCCVLALFVLFGGSDASRHVEKRREFSCCSRNRSVFEKTETVVISVQPPTRALTDSSRNVPQRKTRFLSHTHAYVCGA